MPYCESWIKGEVLRYIKTESKIEREGQLPLRRAGLEEYLEAAQEWYLTHKHRVFNHKKEKNKNKTTYDKGLLSRGKNMTIK